MDLEKLFDRVDHDILIDRLRRKIPDPGVIRLVRAYLNAGIAGGDAVIRPTRGTPQCALAIQQILGDLDLVSSGLPSHMGLRMGGHRGPTYKLDERPSLQNPSLAANGYFAPG